MAVNSPSADRKYILLSRYGVKVYTVLRASVTKLLPNIRIKHRWSALSGSHLTLTMMS